MKNFDFLLVDLLLEFRVCPIGSVLCYLNFDFDFDFCFATQLIQVVNKYDESYRVYNLAFDLDNFAWATS